jgi:hypothetical protein
MEEEPVEPMEQAERGPMGYLVFHRSAAAVALLWEIARWD